jgi:hypothetical protein
MKIVSFNLGPLRLLFASLEGKRGEGFETKEGESGKNKGLWEGRVVGILFSSYYKILII